jgi:hypothetical protein
MRIDREKLKLFLRDIRITEYADEIKLTDNQLAEQIATYLETTPNAIIFPNKKSYPYWEDDTDKETYNHD